MSNFQVQLSEEQSKMLQQSLYRLTLETVERVKQDVALDRDFLTQEKMAQWLGISVNSLKKYVIEGMPVSVLDGRKFFSKKRVSEWILSKEFIT